MKNGADIMNIRKKKGTSICLYFELENGLCKHYGGSKEHKEACRSKCKKQKKVTNLKSEEKYITGWLNWHES